jgi:formylglycine-generating enzyme required for sulfatase activity
MPVTVGAWKRYARDLKSQMPPESKLLDFALNPGWKEDQLPIGNVTWSEARAFCRVAGGRLPTEAEWEYAARAGATGYRYDSLDRIAWSADISGDHVIDSAELVRMGREKFMERLVANHNRPQPVGRKQPNAWKLYDMLGNAWQWTADWWDPGYYERRESSDPAGPSSGELRVMRGGSSFSVPPLIRVSSRAGVAPDTRNGDLGFRCVLE